MKRSGAVDAAKTVAIFGVFLIHASAAGGYPGAVGSASWDAALFWGSILRCAVPVFFMCSGALLLDPERETTWRSVWTRSLPRILLALFFWAAAYEGVSLLLTWRATGVLELAAIETAVLNLLLFRHKSHLYYLHILLLIYALLPVTRVFTTHATKRQLEYLLLAWLVLGVILPTVRSFPPFSDLVGIPQQYPLNLTYACLGYTVAGFYLSRYANRLPTEYWMVLFLAGTGFCYGGTLWMSLRQGTFYQTFLNGNTAGVCAEAVGLFGLCVCLFCGRSAPRWMEAVSRASFCMFLTHLFFLDFFVGHGLSAGAFSPLLSVPVLAAALSVLTFIVWLLLRKIPVVNRWLI